MGPLDWVMQRVKLVGTTVGTVGALLGMFVAWDRLEWPTPVWSGHLDRVMGDAAGDADRRFAAVEHQLAALENTLRTHGESDAGGWLAVGKQVADLRLLVELVYEVERRRHWLVRVRHAMEKDPDNEEYRGNEARLVSKIEKLDEQIEGMLR